jgi:WD40 repeat protein
MLVGITREEGLEAESSLLSLMFRPKHSRLSLSQPLRGLGRTAREDGRVVGVGHFDERAGGESIPVSTEPYLSRDLDRLCERAGLKTRVPEHGRVGSLCVDVPYAETRAAHARITARVEFRQRADGHEHVSGTNRADDNAGLAVAKRDGHVPHTDDPFRLRGTCTRLHLLGVLRVLRENDCRCPRETPAPCKHEHRGHGQRSLAPSPLLASAFNERGLHFSPDGQFAAFTSDESGRGEIYLAPSTVLNARKRLSSGGGSIGRWSPDGHTLFYLAPDGQLMSVPIHTAPALDIGVPGPLFATHGRWPWRDYDVSPDGKRFLAVVPQMMANEQALTAVLNWTAQVQR